MIGKRIKEARQAIGVSAEEVAAFLGVSPATVYRYESGKIAKVPLKYAIPLSDFLKVSPAFLMGFDVEMHESSDEIRELRNDIAHTAPPDIVVPDNVMFVKAYEVMPYEDRVALTEIFDRAFRKLKEKE